VTAARTVLDDPRLEAMARAWVVLLGSDPDGLVRGLRGKEERWRGYVSNMARLLAAADAVDPLR